MNQNHIKKLQEPHNALLIKYGLDYAKPCSQNPFSLNWAEKGVIDEWLEGLLPEIVEKQKADMTLRGYPEEVISQSAPYYGATGGGLTYMFTPTSLGTIIVVKESITGKTLNVSDALDWFFYG